MVRVRDGGRPVNGVNGMDGDEASVKDILGTRIHPVEPATGDVPGAVAFVYVPVQPRRPGGDPDALMFELRSIDGEPGLAVYTDRDRLVAELGSHQPHVRIPVLDLLLHLARMSLPIAVDPVLAPGAERWTDESIKAWRATEEGN